MDKQTIQARLILTAAGKRRHKHYGRTVERAKYYRALSTGEGIEEYMRPYYLRTDESTFKTLCRVTSQVTPAIISSFTDLLKTFYRSFYRRELSYGNDEASERRTKEFEAMLSTYAGKKGVDDYLKERLLEVQKLDPNAWVIQEWKDFDNVLQYAAPYPFEASSEMSLDFAYEVGDLQYLTVRTWLPNPQNPAIPFQRLTCYQKGFAAVLTQIDLKANGPDLLEMEAVELASNATYNIGGATYLYKEFPNGLSEIKAQRMGYQRDLITNGETYAWPWVAAEPSLNHSLKITAELQFKSANAAFETLVRFGDPCPPPNNEGFGGCGGAGEINGHTCKLCGGTGHKKSPTSTIEEIVVTVDTRNFDPSNMIDLSKLFYRDKPDVSLLEWQEQHYEKTRAQAWRDFTGSDMTERANVTETQTATAVQIDRQKEGDQIYEYGLFHAGQWQFTVYAYADITGKRQGLEAQIHVSKDSNPKTIGELTVELQEAYKTDNAPLIHSLEWNLARQTTQDNPMEFLEYSVQARFDPFPNCSPEQKILKSESPLAPLKKRVLYVNFGWIFADIEREHPGFYSMPFEDQNTLVDAKLDEIIAENDKQTAKDAPQITLPATVTNPRIVEPAAEPQNAE